MSDQEIRQALLREATRPVRPTSRLSLNRALTTTTTSATNTTGVRNRPNNHFLTRVVAGVDSHNVHLKRQEHERASRKFEILDRFIKEELERDENKIDNRGSYERGRKYSECRQGGSRATSVSSTGTTGSRPTRFDKRPPPPEKLQEIKQPSSCSTQNVKFSAVVDKIVRHHKEQADARNKIYSLTSIYNEPEKEQAPGLPISDLSGAEQVGMGYDEEEDYDKQSVTKRRKKRRRFEVKRDESDKVQKVLEDQQR
ncbi:hypothetical protein CJU90_0722 [Yarrowia sp. C11]|nr:hypothetical protein CJU90_0722 [Yarrowia sp. C11]